MPLNSSVCAIDKFTSHLRKRGAAKCTSVAIHFSFVAALLLASGCSTAPAEASQTAAKSPSLSTATLQQRLIKGMRRSEVANYLGPAAEVKPFVTAGAEGEIWTYTTVAPGPSRQVAATMRDVEFVDPITGEMRMIQEPVFKNELTTITDVTELLFIKDLLVEWKQKRFADRHLD